MTAPAQDLTAQDKIRKQVEFYFSDSNLPRDAFLLQKVQSSPDGSVPLSLIATFSRMRPLLGLSAKEVSLVAAPVVARLTEALRDSEVLALTEDGRSVKRVAPLPESEQVSQEAEERSIYVSPFPYNTTLDALTEFFSQHARINAVRMRRHMSSKDFKGAIFVEAASVEEAQKLAGMTLTFAGAPLKMEAKAEYAARKEEERKNRPALPEEQPVTAKANGSATPSTEAASAADAEGFTPGCVVKFVFPPEVEFVEPPAFQMIKDSFGGRAASLQFVDYALNARSGFARFATPEAAQVALGESHPAKRALGGYEADLALVEGEEEEAYVREAQVQRAAAVAVKGADRGAKRGRGGRGTRGGMRGRGGRGGPNKRGRR